MSKHIHSETRRKSPVRSKSPHRGISRSFPSSSKKQPINIGGFKERKKSINKSPKHSPVKRNRSRDKKTKRVSSRDKNKIKKSTIIPIHSGGNSNQSSHSRITGYVRKLNY